MYSVGVTKFLIVNGRHGDMDENKSILFIEFKEKGSVDITDLRVQNVTPFQLMSMAMFFEYKAKSILQAQEIQRAFEEEKLEQEKPKIELPKGILKTR